MDLNLIAVTTNSTSYGIVGVNFTHALIEAGHNLSLFGLGWDGHYPNLASAKLDIHPRYEASVRKAAANIKRFNPDAPCVRVYQQFDLASFVGTPRYGFPIFELNDFSEEEKHNIKSCDKIIVTCEGAKQIILDRGLQQEENTKVCPLGVDLGLFYPEDFQINKDKVVFTNVGKWECRKLHNVLPLLMKEALPNEDYLLVMVPFSPLYSQEENNQWVNYYKNILGDKVVFAGPFKTQEELRKLYSGSDYLLAMSLAEGFCLPAMEAMACGTKPIGINYLGMDYLNEANSFPVSPLDGLTRAFDGGRWFSGKYGEWVNFGPLTREATIDRIREAYKLGKKKEPNPHCIQTAKQYQWTNSANRLVEILGEN